MKILSAVAMLSTLLTLASCEPQLQQTLADIKVGALQDCQSDYTGNVAHRDACYAGVKAAVSEGLQSLLLAKPSEDKILQATTNAKSRCTQTYSIMEFRTRNACKQGVDNAEAQLRRFMNN